MESLKDSTHCDSASFLLPTIAAKEFFDQRRDKLTDTETLNSLSKRFKVSKAALLYKMLNLHYISKPEVKRVLDRYSPEIAAKKTKKGRMKTGIPVDKKCLSEMGNSYVSLVTNNYDQRLITYSDALSYCQSNQGTLIRCWLGRKDDIKSLHHRCLIPDRITKTQPNRYFPNLVETN